MKYFIVNAYGRSNRGDSVLLDECIQEIRAVDPGAEISGAVFHGVEEISEIHPDINWSERLGNVVGSGIVGRILSLYCLLVSGFVIFTRWKWGACFLPARQKKTVLGLFDCDVVVSAPGGYIHDTNSAYVIALYHLYLSVWLGKRTLLAPQSYGPMHSALGLAATRYIFKRVGAICSREEYSHDFVAKKLGITGAKLFRCGDSAFWNARESDAFPNLQNDLSEALSDGRKVLGITFVGWTFPHQENPKALYEKYINNMAEVIDHMAERYGLTPVVFNQVDNDRKTALLVKKLCKSTVIVDEESREPEILRSMMSRSTVFLGTRFHSCIFSMMEGIPTFAIAYLPKTRYILNDLNMHSDSIDIQCIESETVIKRLSKYMDDLPAAKKDLARNLEDYREKFLRFSDVLSGFMSIDVR